MKTLFTLSFFVFALCIATITAKAQVDKTDSLALVDLYNSTDGPNWINNENWLSGPVVSWYGIGLNGNRVSDIYLNSNDLSGVLPSSLGNISRLQFLDLTGNQLSGSIPSELGNLNAALFYLSLANNQLSGSIPAELSNLSNLQEIFLSNNQLSGSIPAQLGNLSNLYNLNLYGNQLSGSIPPELGNIPYLGILNLSLNQLNGSIPPELGNLSFLWDLNLSNNQLSSSIPPELGKLASLAILNLSFNQLNGNIPSGLINLSVYDLHLNNNKLSGAIPAFNATFIHPFNIAHNHFTFEGMEEIIQKNPSAIYYPQARIPVNINGNTISVPAGGTLSNNVYLWVKKGQKDVIRIFGDSTFHPKESGTYAVRVKNKIANKLVLTSNIIRYTAPVAANAIIADKTVIINDGFSVYPNPAKDVLHVTTNGGASFSLINKSGKILFTTSIDKTGSINVARLAAGEYYLKNNTTGVAKKVVVIK